MQSGCSYVRATKVSPKRCQGYYLHPQIRLPAAPKIADVATGTSIFLQEIAIAIPSSQCVGFDISDSMFPAPDKRPGNLSLQLQDVKLPFPLKWHGYFDVCNVTIINAATKGFTKN